MRFRSKAYYKDEADRYKRECRSSNDEIKRLSVDLHKSMGDAFRAKSDLKVMKRFGWRKQAIMQCLVGLSYNEASDLIASVQGELGCKHGEEIITYSEQS